MRTIAIAWLVSFACFGASDPVSAATLTLGKLPRAVTISGEIKHGDAERLAAIFVAVKPIANYYPYPGLLYLDSPGGDVTEAIRIAELVKTLGISVATPLDGKGACASSCFLIYVAALERTASGFDTLQIEGRKGNLGPLGVHRPYMPTPQEGPVGAKRQEQVMIEMRTYLAKSNVGHALIDRMMSHASNDIYWLTAEDVRALGNFSPGVEEQLIAKCGYNARRESNLSARDYIRSLQSGPVACVSDYMIDTYGPLRREAVERMRTGWRPWK